MENPWPNNIVEISESYEEVYPSGKKAYEMVHFGPVTERRFITIPEDNEKPNDYLIKRRELMHDRLVETVKYMVNKAINEHTIVGVEKRI